MCEYLTPSTATFYNRKLFHSHQKEQYNTVEQWFRSIKNLLAGCDYGSLSEFMLIDKFISGLDEENFQKFAPWSTLSIDTVQSIVLSSKDSLVLKGSQELTTYQEVGDETENLLAMHEIKVEENADHAEASFEFINLNGENEEPIDSVQHNSEEKMKLKKEIKGVKREKNIGIVCVDCGKCFKHMNGYNYHMRRHSGNNLHECNICGKRFVKKALLKRHSLTHDNDDKTFECYLCLSKFDRIHGLRIHFTMAHTITSTRNLSCSQCSKSFSKQSDLDLHTKIHQGLVEGHKCQQCGKVCDKLAALKEHLLTHLKTKEFVCETCGRAFKTKYFMKRHMQRHNDQVQFKCCECGQVLKSNVTLKHHMRQHTGERPFSCHLCEKTFVTHPSLAKHLRVHRQEKPYGCSECGKRFVTNFQLKIHMNTHTGAKPYKCNQCDKSFTQSGTLRAHQAREHSFNEQSNTMLN